MIANLRAFLHENAVRALLIVLVTVIGIGLYIAAVLRFEGQYVHRHQWVSTFAAHKRELLADIYPNEPVLLMAGDSTTLFGVDAERLSQALHRPVFNYGLGAASGLGFILDETMKTARPRDTVVLMVEDRLLAGTDDVYLNDALVNILEAERFMTAPLGKQIEILLAIPWDIVINGFEVGDGESHFDKVYTDEGFNAYGDMRSDHLTQHEPPALTQKVLPAYAYTDYSVSQLVAFKQALAIRDIELVLMPSPRLDGYLNRPDYQSVFKENQNRLMHAGITVIAPKHGPAEFGYSVDQLYDFDTHLNPIGRQLFTDYVVRSFEDIRRESLEYQIVVQDPVEM
ncbi:MAG TPA: hypothetical protein DEH24_20390 [Alteromonas sp.]|nr:hypothetical protein [Alteromonas sp.]